MPNTSRGILSTVSSVYDPLGFLAPFILTAKQILRELCKIKCSWDDNIPDAAAQKWWSWLKDLNCLSHFSINRSLKPKGAIIQQTQLHHFSDASETGYGVVTYLRLTDTNGTIYIRFLMGKARVAPLKQTTIPRLELTAAVLAAKVDRMLKAELQIPMEESVFWTDSTSVLKYIANETKRFHTFVANRVSTIRELSKPEQWKHVSSRMNPADDASHGLRAEVFLWPNTWINGPEFLVKPEAEWPTYPTQDKGIPSDDPEVKHDPFVNSIVLVDNPTVRFLTYFSEWNSLKKAVAWLLKVKETLQLLCKRKRDAGDAVLPRHHKHQNIKSSQRLSVEDMLEAERAIISFVQRQHFKEEIFSLVKGNSVRRGSSLHRLDPQMDNGILRVGGRLSRAAMPIEAQHPAILPKDSHISKLILTDIHKRLGHFGRNHVISKLCQRFWIPSANALTRRIIS